MLGEQVHRASTTAPSTLTLNCTMTSSLQGFPAAQRLNKRFHSCAESPDRALKPSALGEASVCFQLVSASRSCFQLHNSCCCLDLPRARNVLTWAGE